MKQRGEREMGRLCNNEDDHNQGFVHFSHEHPLQLIELNRNTSEKNDHQETCSGCKLEIRSSYGYYSCQLCNAFSLHKTCFNMPRKISHPAHPQHDLILTLSSSFHCKACGDSSSSGLAYSCQICSQNYHILCSVLPLETSHFQHPHLLTLEFSPPYDELKAFRCDICRNPGLDHWLYCCKMCGFDVHLNCIKSSQNPPTQITMASPSCTDGSSLISPNSGNYVNFESNSPNGVHPNRNNFGTNQATTISRNAMSMNYSSSGVFQSGPFVTNVNQGTNYGVHPNMNAFGPATIFSSNGMPIGTMNTPQLRSNDAIYLNQGTGYPNGMQPNWVHSNQAAGFYGTNQAMYGHQNGFQMNGMQSNNGFCYRNQVNNVGSSQGAMSGMQGMLIAGVASGIGQQFGQDMFGGGGSGSSGQGGDSDIISSWFGGS